MSYSSLLVGMEILEPLSAQDKYVSSSLMAIGIDVDDPEVWKTGLGFCAWVNNPARSPLYIDVIIQIQSYTIRIRYMTGKS
jgi:hypothetical protein